MASPVTFTTVRRLALAMPDVVESTTYGTPAFKIGGKLLTCRAINKSAEPNTLAVVVSFDDRDQLIAEQPDVYYLTSHYESSPCVLVRMPKISGEALRDLLLMSWRFVHAKARTRPRRGR